MVLESGTYCTQVPTVLKVRTVLNVPTHIYISGWVLCDGICMGKHDDVTKETTIHWNLRDND